jgi:hypothetical protein
MSYLKDREIWLSSVPTGNPPAGYVWVFIQNGVFVVRDSNGVDKIMATTTGTVTNATSASYVEYSNVANKPALISSSAQIVGYNVFATTGSNQFNGSQAVTGSLTVTGQVVAQTLNVQQVTSSIVFSSGSNIFGNSLSNTQQFTGSVSVTGSLTSNGALTGTSATFRVSADRNLATRFDTNIVLSAQSDTAAPESLRIYADTFRLFTATTAGGLTERFTVSNAGTAIFTGQINANATETNTINPVTNASISIAGGYSGIRSAVDHSFNIDVYNSASPINVLKITQAGAATFTGTTGNRLTLYNSGNNSGLNGLVIDSDIYPGITFNSRSSASGAVIGGGKIVYNAVATGYGSASLGGSILLQADNAMQFSTGGDNVRVTIASGGNVYIGGVTSGFFATSGYMLGLRAPSGDQTFMSIAAPGQTLDSQGLVIGVDPNAASFYMRDSKYMNFFTANTERMRITSGGFLKASNSGTYVSSTGTFHEFISSTTNNNIAYFYNTSASPYGPYMRFSGAAPNNGVNYYLYFDDTSQQRFIVYSNGGISNFQANDVNLSDERTKKDIAPLESYWDKFKAIEIVKFKYKDQTHDDYNIGVIAQQVEQVAPEFVDVDGWDNKAQSGQDGNANTNEQEPMKSIYTADLYHATIKVLQEAMAKIESLEAILQRNNLL